MIFRRDRGSKRRVIFLCEDRDACKSLGKWHINHLNTKATTPEARRFVRHEATAWNEAGGSSMYLPEPLSEERKFFLVATVFNIKDGQGYRKVFTPFPTHCIAGHLLIQLDTVIFYKENRIFPRQRWQPGGESGCLSQCIGSLLISRVPTKSGCFTRQAREKRIRVFRKLTFPVHDCKLRGTA